MCDNILASPGSTDSDSMLFGKNSDRQCNEAQIVECLPGMDHAPGTPLTCTYVTIPQARRTHAVLLCRPCWGWGAEMGANEHGIVIGNQGIHARSPGPEEPALTGMDLVRLALERAYTAWQAVEVITSLLAQHGQGGNCGHLTPTYYNNGFMIADAREAYVLETVGREWLVERVQGVRAISNAYSIRTPLGVSPGLRTLIRDAGWSAEDDPDFAQAIANPHREHIGHAGARRATSTSLLRACQGRVSVQDTMNILRDHGDGTRYHPEWRAECLVQRTLCMHAGAEDRPGQTVGAMVSELRRHTAVHWVTGTAATCISIFKPVLLEVPLPSFGPPPTDRFDARTLWWRHEQVHRAALLSDFGTFLEAIRPERDALETQFRARVASVLDGGDALERARVIEACWREALALEERWRERIALSVPQPGAHTRAWETLNRIAGLEPLRQDLRPAPASG